MKTIKSSPSNSKKNKSSREPAQRSHIKRRDLAFFLIAILFLLSAAATAFLCCAGSKRWVEQNRTILEAKTQEKKIISDTVADSSRVKQEIELYQPKFQKLVSMGVVGVEKRIGLIEDMDSLAEERNLFSTRYDIKPQHTYQLDPAINLGSYNLSGTELSLKMDMLHEGDLFSLAKGLEEIFGGLLVFQKVTIKRTNTGSVEEEGLQEHLVSSKGKDELKPNLDAEFVIYRISFAANTAEQEDPGAI